MPDLFVDENLNGIDDKLENKPEKEISDNKEKEDKVKKNSQDPIVDQSSDNTSLRKEAKESPKEHTLGLLDTFCEYPTGVTYKTQADDEMIRLFLRRHMVTNIPWFVITILLMVLPPIIIPLFAYITIFTLTVSTSTFFLMVLFYYLVILGYAFINFAQWFYNIGMVTDKNIVDIDYTEIVNVHVATTKATQIEDVRFQQSGFFQTLFNYGDIFIQTAGSSPNIEFLRVPRPGQATYIIRGLIGQGRRK